MFKPKSLNVLVILLLLAGIGFSLQKLLSTKTLEENPTAKGQEPVLPIEWSEPTWPTPDKLGKSPTIMTLLPIPDWAAKDMQNKKIIPGYSPVYIAEINQQYKSCADRTNNSIRNHCIHFLLTAF